MSVLCGSTIITHYNNKTYRIDDIDFSMTPLSTFDHHGTNVRCFILIYMCSKLYLLQYFYIFRYHLWPIIKKIMILKLKIQINLCLYQKQKEKT